MIKLELTSVLYSNKNFDLAYKVNKCCYKMGMNLVNCINFIELTIKTHQLKPQILFCDMTSVNLNSSQLKMLFNGNECKNTKIVFIGYDNQEDTFKNLCIGNSDFVSLSNIESYIFSCFDVINMSKLMLEQNIQNVELSESVVQLLYSLGFSPKHTGFNFLKEILCNIVSNGGVFSSLIGDQYPFIAVKYKTTCSNIERNIRNAIASAFEECKDVWKDTFSGCISVENSRRPTNREFICLCADKIGNLYKQKQYAF